MAQIRVLKNVFSPSVDAQEALHAAGLPCDQFEEIEGQARVAARQAAAAEERAAAAEEEVAALRAELADRPTQVCLRC